MPVISEIKKRSSNLADISNGFYSQYTGISNEVIGNTLKTICSVASRGGTIDLGTLSAGTYRISVKKFSGVKDGVETPLKLTTQVNGKGINVPVSESSKGTFTLSEPSVVKLYHAFANSYDYYLLEDLMAYKGEEEKEFEPFYLDITKYDNSPISNITLDGVDYHFAKSNEVENGTCENSVNEPIIDMQISGNTIQDGTPTLDTPIEIQSVGVKTKNLVDIPIIDGSIGTKIISCYIDQTISFSCQEYPTLIARDDGTETSIWRIAFKRLDGSTTYAVDSTLKGEGTTLTTVTADNPIIEIEYRSTYIREGAYKGIQIEYGREVTSYEPYGYKIPVKASGKNLFDKSKWVGAVEETFNGIDCLKIKDSGATQHYIIDGDSSDIYTLTFKYYRASDSEDKISNFYSSSRGALITNTKHNTKYTCIVYGGDVVYFTGWGRDMYIDLTITQLEKGEIATSFEPYIEPATTDIYIKEPLRMINGIADILDYKNKKVIRNVGSIIYNATESWSKYDSGNGYMETNDIFPDGKPVLCNMFVNSTTLVKTLAIRKNYANIYVYGVQDYYPTQAEWHAFLAENNMEVIGQLVTPVEESIEIPQLETFDGTTIFEIDTNIKPTENKIKYWKQI